MSYESGPSYLPGGNSTARLLLGGGMALAVAMGLAAADGQQTEAAQRAVTEMNAPDGVNSPNTYTVAKGDTLYQIGVNSGVSYQQLATDNGIDDPAQIEVGQVLLIPAIQAMEASPSDQATTSVETAPAAKDVVSQTYAALAANDGVASIANTDQITYVAPASIEIETAVIDELQDVPVANVVSILPAGAAMPELTLPTLELAAEDVEQDTDKTTPETSAESAVIEGVSDNTTVSSPTGQDAAAQETAIPATTGSDVAVMDQPEPVIETPNTTATINAAEDPTVVDSAVLVPMIEPLGSTLTADTTLSTTSPTVEAVTNPVVAAKSTTAPATLQAFSAENTHALPISAASVDQSYLASNESIKIVPMEFQGVDSTARNYLEKAQALELTLGEYRNFTSSANGAAWPSGIDTSHVNAFTGEIGNQKLSGIDHLIVHWTGGSEADGIQIAKSLLSRKGDCCSIQLGMDTVGHVYAFTEQPDMVVAGAKGVNEFGHSNNNYSIGIEVATTGMPGSYHMSNGNTYTGDASESGYSLDQQKQLVYTMAWLCEAYNLDPNIIIGHEQVSTSGKVDIPPQYAEVIRHQVRELLNAKADSDAAKHRAAMTSVANDLGLIGKRP